MTSYKSWGFLDFINRLNFVSDFALTAPAVLAGVVNAKNLTGQVANHKNVYFGIRQPY